MGTGVDPNTRQMKGQIQMYNIPKKKTQFVPAQTALYAQVQLDGRPNPANILCLAAPNKIMFSEVDNEVNPFRAAVDIVIADPSDVPTAMEYSEKYGFLFVVTAHGILYCYDVASTALVIMSKVTQSIFFTTISEQTDNGFIGINTKGEVISVSIDSNKIVGFITGKLGNTPLSIKVAGRANLSGSDDLFITQFNQYFNVHNYQEAARTAANSPNGILRTAETIQKFKSAPALAGQASPLMQYLAVLLDKGKLNERESVELVIPVLQQGKKEVAEKWLREGKLTASEELGTVIRQYDLPLALTCFLLAKSHEKAIQIYCELGDFDKVLQYSKATGYKANYNDLLRGVTNINPTWAQNFAIKLYHNPDGVTPLIDIAAAQELFFSKDLIKELSGLMVDVLKENQESQSRLQTRYLEILLLKRPDIANALFEKHIFSQYDQAYIAHACENAGLINRALEHYTDLSDILRCIQFTSQIPEGFLLGYVQQITAKLGIKFGTAILKVLVKNKGNLPLCVEIGKNCATLLGPKEIIQIYEDAGLVEAVYLFLQGVAATIDDKEIVFRFIQAAVKTQQIKEVERVVRESKSYDPKEVKDFLKESRLSDPQPLIIVCDRHNFVDDLTKYLYDQNQHKAIERYVTGFNPKSAPIVCGTLIDLEANEEFIQSLLNQVRSSVPVPPLIDEFEKRNKLRLLQYWLEARVNQDKDIDPITHSALAKIYIETNNNPDKFLHENQYYDPLIVGKYCEKRDLKRAILCYKKGKCDNEFISATNKNGLFKELAKYLVERRDPGLWAGALSPENPSRRLVIDQVVSTALPNSKDPEDVSSTVKAFMAADLPNELIELLEVIMLRKSDFSANKNLQNLLLITSIKAKSTKVKEYLTRLDNYDGAEVAKFAIQSGMYEEAYDMYKKIDKFPEALNVLINNIGEIERATDFAQTVNTVECWIILAKAQLAQDLITESIDSYIKADYVKDHRTVIDAAISQQLYVPLIKFLKLARKLHENSIDSELIYCYARTEQFGDIEELVAGQNYADLKGIAERLYDEGIYEAAKTLFQASGNFARLATTLVRLGQFQQAVDAAKKGNSIRTWKEVCFSCVDAGQFRLAQICGLVIAVQADELEELTAYYENRGHFEEIVKLLEICLNVERTHMGIFTGVAVLYSKYNPEKLLEHIKVYNKRLNLSPVVKICEKNLQWAEICWLYFYTEEFDYAASKMIDHIDAWTHSGFKDILAKVTNLEIYYRSVDVYLKQHPTLINDLLLSVATKIDHSRVVQQVKRAGFLFLIKPYLIFVQQHEKPENTDVNEALIEVYLEEEDVTALDHSITNFKSFDQLGLARRLEKHPLLQFRRISSRLYIQNQRYSLGLQLAKKDKMYEDAMTATAASGDATVAEELLRFIANDIDEEDKPACFAACLYTCYDIIPLDLVMEVSWAAGLQHYAQPYIIQSTHDYTSLLVTLKKDFDNLKSDKEERDKQENQNTLKRVKLPSSLPPQQPSINPNQIPPSPIPYGVANLNASVYASAPLTPAQYVPNPQSYPGSKPGGPPPPQQQQQQFRPNPSTVPTGGYPPPPQTSPYAPAPGRYSPGPQVGGGGFAPPVSPRSGGPGNSFVPPTSPKSGGFSLGHSPSQNLAATNFFKF